MPRYIGRGPTFHLVTCELMPSPDASFEEKKRFHETTCNNCGFFRDTIKRANKAMSEGKEWRKLMCVHPKNTVALKKWTLHVTDWAVVPSV